MANKMLDPKTLQRTRWPLGVDGNGNVNVAEETVDGKTIFMAIERVFYAKTIIYLSNTTIKGI